jgi:hypothetical protein
MFSYNQHKATVNLKLEGKLVIFPTSRQDQLCRISLMNRERDSTALELFENHRSLQRKVQDLVVRASQIGSINISLTIGAPPALLQQVRCSFDGMIASVTQTHNLLQRRFVFIRDSKVTWRVTFHVRIGWRCGTARVEL